MHDISSSTHADAPRAVTREHVLALEREIQRLPQASFGLWHYFAPGLYARCMLIPAGCVLTGAVHRTEHLCIVSGDITVTADNGSRRIASMHYILTSKPGEKRAGYAHADTYWTTVHATNERDLDKLVEELTESRASELLGGAENVQLLNNKAED